MNKTLLSTILIISLFQKFDFHNSTLQQEDNSVYLLAPVTAGQTLSINHGYNDPLPYDISQIKCKIGTPPDHCDNQKYGLDLVPSNLSDLRILAPLPGKIAWISGECLGILTKDNLNLNICHFQNYNVAEQVDVSRGDVLGTRIVAKGWIHLSLDDANYGGIRQPIPFNGAHTIEGISFDPGPDTKRGPSFNNIIITSTNAQTGTVPSHEMNWWESIWHSVKNAWNDFWNSISTGGIIYAKELKKAMVTETVSPTDTITPEPPFTDINYLIGTWEGELAGGTDTGIPLTYQYELTISDQCEEQADLCIIKKVINGDNWPIGNLPLFKQEGLDYYFGSSYDQNLGQYTCITPQPDGTIKVVIIEFTGSEGYLHRKIEAGIQENLYQTPDLTNAESIAFWINYGLTTGDATIFNKVLIDMPQEWGVWNDISPRPSCQEMMGRWCDISKTGFIQEIESRIDSKPKCTYRQFGENFLSLEMLDWYPLWDSPLGERPNLVFLYLRNHLGEEFKLSTIYFDHHQLSSASQCPDVDGH